MDTDPSDDLMMGEESEMEEEKWAEPPMLYAQMMGESSITVATAPSTSNEPVNCMALNTNKAGMEGLDKERINKIIIDASKGSRFYENEKKKEAQVNARIDQMRQQIAKLTDQEMQAAVAEVDRTVQELELSRDLSRTIVHLDMDAFYAAVETRDNPSLGDKPMAVGGMSMLSTSNYIARKYGVRAGMPGFIGKKLCPDLVIVPTNFDKYRAVSKQVREILAQYDANFCPMSLDEAYMDITEHMEKRQGYTETQRTFGEMESLKKVDSLQKGVIDMENKEEKCNGEIGLQVTTDSNNADRPIQSNTCTSRLQITTDSDTPSDLEHIQSSSEVMCEPKEVNKVTFGLTVEDAVKEIRFRIQQRTQLTASAGIAPNCMLAKVCSDKNKPNGQYRIEPTRETVMNFVSVLPIRKVSGIGKVTERMLSALGIHTCADLYQQRGLLHILFLSISSQHFLSISLGLGSTRVERDSERKSMSTERTFREINKPDELYSKCKELCEALANDLAQAEVKGKTVAIKIKTVKFEVKTRACTAPSPVSSTEELYNVAKDLLKTEIRTCQPEPLRLRLMGVRLSSLEHRGKSNEKQDTITRFFKKKPPKQNICETNSLLFKNTNNTSSKSTNMTGAQDLIENSLAQNTEGVWKKPHPPSLDNGRCAASIDQDINLVASVPGVNSHNPIMPRLSDPLENAEVTAASSSTSAFAENVGSSTTGLVCPICNEEQPTEDLEALNTHIDMCLNKGAIKEILHQQAHTDMQTTTKPLSPTKPPGKRSSSGLQSTAKRRRQNKTQGSTLDKFFS